MRDLPSNAAMRPLVLGASGVVGNYIVQHLVAAGMTPLALSRSERRSDLGVTWIKGDLEVPGTWSAQPFDTVFCTAHPKLAMKSIDHIASPSLRRLVVFTSSSINTKLDAGTGNADERSHLQSLAEGEVQLTTECSRRGVAWTVLRPTMIYAEGKDVNVTRLAQIIRRFGFLPLAGVGSGLRQPVHAEDLAVGAIAAAASPAAFDSQYVLPGKETLTYHEMVGRIFDGMGRPRRIVAVPPIVWKLAFAAMSPFFPNANAAMGTRMSMDMVFDGSAAVRDFGWNPRPFRPLFRSLTPIEQKE